MATVQPDVDFQSLFESTPGLLLVLRPDAPRYTIVTASDAYCRATGFRRTDLVGQPLFEVYPEAPPDPMADGRRLLGDSLDRVLAHRQADLMGLVAYPVHRDEAYGGHIEMRWWHPLNVPVLDEHGEVRHIIHRLEDATDFLSLQQGGLAQAMAQAPIAPPALQGDGTVAQHATSGATEPRVLVIEPDRPMRQMLEQRLRASGLQVISHDQAHDLLKLAQLSRPAVIVLDLDAPDLQPEALIAAVHQDADLSATPFVVLGSHREEALRLRLVTAGAQDFLLKPISPDELLTRVHRLVLGRMTTQALHHREEQLQQMFEQAFDGVFIADPSGHYHRINPAGCALVDIPREQLQGCTAYDLVVPEQRARLAETRAGLISGKAPIHIGEWTLRRRDGSHLPVEVRARCLPDGGWVSFIRDLSKHKKELASRESQAEQLDALVKERTAQLRKLGADLEAVEDRERRQIAQDLHDDLGQLLAAARIWLAPLVAHTEADVSQAARETDGLIDRANRSIRSLAAQLAPAMLYELGLVPAIEWLGQDIGRTFGLKVTVQDDGQPKPLSMSVRAILYRATRELLINAAKHARSPTASVQLSRDGQRVTVRVSDAGVGFDPDQVSADHQRGMGLVSVRERLSFIGGTAEIRSIPGDGTEAVISALLDESVADPNHGGNGNGEHTTRPIAPSAPSAAIEQGPTDPLQSIIDALVGRVVVIEADGAIRCVNRAWREFAAAQGDPDCLRCGPGINYLAVCNRGASDDSHARRAEAGIRAVLNGGSTEFVDVYPCMVDGTQRWFFMRAAPLPGGIGLVTHIELSEWVDPGRMAALDSPGETPPRP